MIGPIRTAPGPVCGGVDHSRYEAWCLGVSAAHDGVPAGMRLVKASTKAAGDA